MLSTVIAGLVVMIIGFSIMIYGGNLFLNSINCGDVPFCYEEKVGVIHMTMGALIAGVSAGYMPHLNRIESGSVQLSRPIRE